ncbi:MAG TPA: hypothetical protein VHZ76_07530 [Gammaproteobacteria bacterium]|jgi:hypothetical protein|nr:hypothetical protein [Gammaproteobacteria bacterium]
MPTKTIYVNFKKLLDAGKKEASLVLRIMCACNDIATANYHLSKAMEDDLKPSQEHIHSGNITYFIKLHRASKRSA